MKRLFKFDIPFLEFMHMQWEGNKRISMIRMLVLFCFHHAKIETSLLWSIFKHYKSKVLKHEKWYMSIAGASAVLSF